MRVILTVEFEGTPNYFANLKTSNMFKDMS